MGVSFAVYEVGQCAWVRSGHEVLAYRQWGNGVGGVRIFLFRYYPFSSGGEGEPKFLSQPL